MSRKKAVNLFSHSGGVAAGAHMHDIDTVLYTTHSLPLKGLIQHKIDNGLLPIGEIHKFCYNVGRSTIKEPVDVVIGLVREHVYQFRELLIPNERDLFDLAHFSRDQAIATHRKTLHEISLVAKAANANQLVFFFTYDPCQGDSLRILTDRGFQTTVYEFACTGPLNPAPYLYCLIGTLMPVLPVVDLSCHEEPLEVAPEPQPTLLSCPVLSPSSLVQRVVLWDIAPTLVDQVLQKVLEEKKVDAKIVLIKTTIKPAHPYWDMDRISPGEILDLSRQPEKNPFRAAQLLGWPQDWTPDLLY